MDTGESDRSVAEAEADPNALRSQAPRKSRTDGVGLQRPTPGVVAFTEGALAIGR